MNILFNLVLKLKRKILNFIYKYSGKLNNTLFDLTCDKYFIIFRLYLDDYQIALAEIPIIIHSEQGINIEPIIGNINDELVRDFKFSTYYYGLEKILNKQRLNEIKNKIVLDYQNYDMIGTIQFDTLKRENPLIENLTPLSIDINKTILGYTKLNSQIINFGILKTNKKRKIINPVNEHQIYIKFDDYAKTLINNFSKEEQFEKMKELVKHKKDK